MYVNHFTHASEQPKKLSGYDRKKYVNKLVMIYLLGYKIAAVGYSEALNLISSPKISEKLAVRSMCDIASLFSSCMCHPVDNLPRLHGFFSGTRIH